MVTEQIQSYQSYQFGSSRELTPQQMQALVDLFSTPPDAARFRLGGRNSVTIAELEGIGSVAVKYFTRGGLNRLFIKHHYLRWRPRTRCQIEFDMLDRVRSLDVMAPEPVAWAHQGGLFYRGWLVTREIKKQRNLAELSSREPQQARKVLANLIPQVVTLIENGILHIDLHPGNVLVDERQRVFLLDFDKACLSTRSSAYLKSRYLRRWRRAVLKHSLPQELWTRFQSGLGLD